MPWKNGIEKGLVAMVSASGDGAFLAAVLAKFGVILVRGSTSRRGPQALLEATRWLRKGYSVAITPDGPRGPSHQIQDGIIYLAQVSGRPIVPISNFTRWKIRLRSWDRFQIPLPFARCELYDNDPPFSSRATPPTPTGKNCASDSKNPCAPSPWISSDYTSQTEKIAKLTLAR